MDGSEARNQEIFLIRPSMLNVVVAVARGDQLFTDDRCKLHRRLETQLHIQLSIIVSQLDIAVCLLMYVGTTKHGDGDDQKGGVRKKPLPHVSALARDRRLTRTTVRAPHAPELAPIPPPLFREPVWFY